MEKKTANLYIDGYNFYYAITKAAKKPEKYRDKIDDEMCIGYAWCNFKKLAEEQLLLPDEQLERIVYCTAKVEDNSKEEKNQQVWLKYLGEYIPQIEIIYGTHRPDPKKKEKRDAKKILKISQSGVKGEILKKFMLKNFLKIFNLIEPKREEKMTDVNIAVEMVIDGLCREKNVGTIILITEDADLLPAVRAVCKRHEELGAKPVNVRVYIPIPKKVNQWKELKEIYKLKCLTEDKLTADKLAKSVLPYPRGDSRVLFKKEEKMLDTAIREKIYKEPLDRYWTYSAIKAYKRNRCGFPEDNMVCNIATKELKKTDTPDWKKTPVYDYQKGKWIVYGEIEK